MQVQVPFSFHVKAPYCHWWYIITKMKTSDEIGVWTIQWARTSNQILTNIEGISDVQVALGGLAFEMESASIEVQLAIGGSEFHAIHDRTEAGGQQARHSHHAPPDTCNDDFLGFRKLPRAQISGNLRHAFHVTEQRGSHVRGMTKTGPNRVSGCRRGILFNRGGVSLQTHKGRNIKLNDHAWSWGLWGLSEVWDYYSEGQDDLVGQLPEENWDSTRSEFWLWADRVIAVL